MLKRVVVILIVAIVLGLAGFAVLAWRPAIDPVSPQAAAAFAPALVQQGEILAGAGYCANCHTAKGGKPLAGGYAMATQFGTIYSTNITPDAATGIGAWSEDAFRRAMREGVARDGAHLFPAFPYDHFTKLTDADISALYAYLMTRPAIDAPARTNGLPFPLGIRVLQAGWKLLFFRSGVFAPSPDHDDAWNRGAYLAEGVSHCGACHTPRNPLGAEEHGQAYGGAAIDGWAAPALTAANPTPAVWTEDEIFAYLRSGVSRLHGTAAGPMAPVVRGLTSLPDSDIRAIAHYFAAIDGAAAREPMAQPAIEKALASEQPKAGATEDRGARLYAAACASCHYNGAGGADPLRPDLALVSAVALDDPANLLHVMLGGIDASDGAPGVVMPAFGSWSDADLAAIAAYLRATRTTKAPWPELPRKIAAIRTNEMAGE